MKWALLALALLLPLVLPVAGGLVGYAVEGRPGVAPGALAGAIGFALLIGAAWIARGVLAAREERRIWREGNSKTDPQA